MNEAGQLIEQYSYDAHGTLQVRACASTEVCEGAGPCALTTTCGAAVKPEAGDHAGTHGNTLLYAGTHRDPVTGHYRMGARWYDPTLRTFMSRDPAGYAFSFDEWAYTVGDPWNFVDRTGWGPEGCLNARNQARCERRMERREEREKARIQRQLDLGESVASASGRVPYTETEIQTDICGRRRCLVLSAAARDKQTLGAAMAQLMDALDALSTEALRLLYKRAVRGSEDGMLHLFFLAEHPLNIGWAEEAAEFKPLIAYIAFHTGVTLAEAADGVRGSIDTLLRPGVVGVTTSGRDTSIVPIAGRTGSDEQTRFWNNDQGQWKGLPVTVVHELLHQLFGAAGLDDEGSWATSEGHAFIHGLAVGLYSGIGARADPVAIQKAEKDNFNTVQAEQAYQRGVSIFDDTRAAERQLRRLR